MRRYYENNDKKIKKLKDNIYLNLRNLQNRMEHKELRDQLNFLHLSHNTDTEFFIDFGKWIADIGDEIREDSLDLQKKLDI